MTAVVTVQVRSATDLTRRLQQAAQRLNRRVEQFDQAYTECAMVLVEVHREKPWITLGFDSFETYISAHVPLLRQIKLDRTQRRELVSHMTDQGMSTRAIGATLGVAQNTVMSDQRQVTQTESLEPDVVDAEVVDDVTEHEPQRAVVGRDGRTRSYGKTRAPRNPRARPITSEFQKAVRQTTEKVTRLVDLTHDVRFPANADQLAASHRDELINTIDALSGVLTRLT